MTSMESTDLLRSPLERASKIMVVIAGLLVLAALGFAAFAFFTAFRFVFDDVSTEASRLALAGCVTALACATIVGGAIRKARKPSELRDPVLQDRSRTYARALAVWIGAQRRGESLSDYERDQLEELDRLVALQAGACVLRTYAVLRDLGPRVDLEDETVRAAVNDFLVAAREEAGHDDSGLEDAAPLELALTSVRFVEPVPAVLDASRRRPELILDTRENGYSK